MEGIIIIAINATDIADFNMQAERAASPILKMYPKVLVYAVRGESFSIKLITMRSATVKKYAEIKRIIMAATAKNKTV